MSAQPPTSIGFAAGLLGAEAYRLTVLATGPGWVALDKPSGVAFEEHPWQNGAPTLLGQLRTQLEAGKPELLRLGLTEPAAVFGPEPETAGIVVLAERATTMAAWREALGSGAFRFEYEFVARAEDAPEDAGLCDLPVGMDDSQQRAFVSHRNGKHAQTRFEPGRAGGRWRVWAAHTPYPRRDQVRIHASECGIRIAGELKYGRSGRVTLTDTTPKGRLNKGEDKPLHRGLLLRVARMTGKVNGQVFEITAPRPDDFATVVKRLSKGI
jgi:23S rRNA-/tRNA-specific pseudouridylate synthase